MGDDQQRPFPPMQISDLLILTLTISLSLACVAPAIQEFLALPDRDLRIPRWRGVVPEITDYTTIGIALFGLLVLARQRLRGAPLAVSPGHWVILAAGPYFVLLLLAWLLMWFSDDLSDGHFGWHRVQDTVMALALAAIVTVVSRRIGGLEPRWRVCLLLILIWNLITVAWCVLEIDNQIGPYTGHLLAAGASVFLLAFWSAFVAVVIDVLRGVRRDWLHYLAVAMLAIYAASNVLHYGRLLTRWWRDLYAHVIGWVL